jgi:hypothetical protein
MHVNKTHGTFVWWITWKLTPTSNSRTRRGAWKVIAVRSMKRTTRNTRDFGDSSRITNGMAKRRGPVWNCSVIEFGNSLYQPTLDRYITGEDVPFPAISKVWRNTTQVAGWDSAIYLRLLATIREVNQKLPVRMIRVLAGDPPSD